jgi:uncharacterized repeat protein (TIGR01451 family)
VVSNADLSALSDRGQGQNGQVTVDYVVPADTTGPTDSPVLPPEPNASGWNDTDVSVTWNWADAGSGIDPTKCPQVWSTTGHGGVATVTASCTDLAGNVTTDSVPVKIDKDAPVDDPVVTTTATGASVAWNWSDDLSGVDAANCTQTSSQTGTGQLTLTASCTDVAGNTATDSKTVTVTAPASKADVKVNVSGPSNGQTNIGYTYTVKVTNTGPGTATSVGTTALLPVNATLVSASGRYTRIGPLLVWKTVPTLAANASTSYTVTVRYTKRETG